MTRPLEYIGPVIDQNTDVSYRAYVTSRMANNLSSASIDTAINNALASYATKSYVDTRDALNATQAYIQTQDNLRVKLSQKDVSNGVPGLSSSGRVSASRIQSSTIQRYPRAFWSPAAYNASAINLSTSTETQVYTCGITNPGYPYKILVFGTVDGLSTIDGQQPIVSVRVGPGVAGTVIARGRGGSDSYNYWAIDDFNRSVNPGLGGGAFWSETWVGEADGHTYVDGNQARWQAEGAGYSKQGFFLKSGDAATTYDDWQEIRVRISRESEAVTLAGQPGRLYLYGRVSNDWSKYIYFNMMRNRIRMGYATSGSEIEVDTTTWSFDVGDIMTARMGALSNNKRQIQFLKNSETIFNWNDSSAVTSMNASSRGWGWGQKAGGNEFSGVFYEQQEPAAIDWITINDLQPGVDGSSYTPINLQPVNLHTQPSNSGSKTLTITVNRLNTSAPVSLTTFRPSLYVMAVAI